MQYVFVNISKTLLTQANLIKPRIRHPGERSIICWKRKPKSRDFSMTQHNEAHLLPIRVAILQEETLDHML